MKEDVYGGLEVEAMTRLVQSRPQEGHKTVPNSDFQSCPKVTVEFLFNTFTCLQKTAAGKRPFMAQELCKSRGGRAGRP